MADYTTRRDTLRRTYRKQIAADTPQAVLGLPSGLIPDVYHPGKVWIQITASGGRLSNRTVKAPTKYFNLAPGTPVKLKYDNRGRLQIDEPDADLQIATGVDPVAAAMQSVSPSTPQSYFETLRLISKSGLLVSLKGWNAISGVTAKAASYSDIDLSAHVPAAVGGVDQMRYVGIFVKADFTGVELVDSTPRATSDLPLNAADESEMLIAATPGDIPGWAIKLVTGQTAIAQADIDNGSGAADWRGTLNIPLVVTDSSVTVQNVSKISVVGGTVADLGDGEAELTVTGGGSGTVTSVALTVPSRQTVAGSPVTTSGTLAITDNTQSANQIFSGPSSGSAATPAFRALVAADLPTSISSKDLFVATASGTVASSTSETTIIGSGVGSLTLPANFLTVGKALRVRVLGVWGTTIIAPTINIKFKLGSTVIVATGAVTAPTSLSNQWFEVIVELTCRTTGASGTVIAQGAFLNAEASATFVAFAYPMSETSTNTVDTTGTLAVDVTATWGTSNAANTITGTNAVIQSIDTSPQTVGGWTQGCRVYNNANISIANNTATALTFNSERYDTDSMHNTSTNTSRIAINTAGKYNVIGQCTFNASATGARSLQLLVNGSIIIAEKDEAGSAAIGARLNLSTIWDFSVNDYIEMVVTQTSGGSLNILNITAYSPEFMASRIG